MTAISVLKSALFAGAEKVGVLDSIKRSAWRRQRLLILCYHGVSLRDEHDWSGLYVSPEHLDSRMRLLHALGIRVAPLASALDDLRRGTLSEPTVVLTFDDGTADFALRAAPILGEYRMPATVYLTTYYAQRQLPVFDPWTAYMMWKGADQRADLGPLGYVESLPRRSDEVGRRALHERLRAACQREGLTVMEKDEVIRRLCASIGIAYDDLCRDRFIHIMNTTEVRSLRRDLVDVQLHTHRHRSPEDRTDFREELDLNKRCIEAVLEDSVVRTHFCYPSGVYSKALRDNAASYPLASATTCDPGMATRQSDHLLLPRFADTMSVSAATFTAWVTGAAALLPLRKAEGSAGIRSQ